MPLVTRCSRLPLLTRCPAAAIEPMIHMESDDAEARLGTATHAVLIGVRGRPMFPGWVNAGMDVNTIQLAAAFWRVDHDELAALCFAGWRCWESERVQPFFPNPKTEVELISLSLTGHADLLSIVGDEARIGDLKSGRRDDEHDEQMKGYAHLTCSLFGTRSARACVIGIRNGTADWLGPWSREELEAWHEGLQERLADTQTFRPGAHCAHCPRALECPARRRMIASHVEGLLRVHGDGGNFLNTEQDRAQIYADMLGTVKLVERMCEAARSQIKAEVVMASGRLPTGDGRELVIEQQTRREIVVTPDSMDLVAAECSSHPAFLATMEFCNKAVETAVRANAPRGEKSAAVKALYDRLESAGLLITRTTDRLECRRLVPQLEHAHGNSSTATE